MDLHRAAIRFRLKLHDLHEHDSHLSIEDIEHTAEYTDLKSAASPISIGVKNLEGQLPLHILLDKDRVFQETSSVLNNSRLNLESVRLLATKETVNVEDDCKRTSLHKAVSLGRLDIVELLVEKGASCNEDSEKVTPLLIAARRARIDLFQAMCDENTHLGEEEATELLREAITRNHSTTEAMVELLLSKGAKVEDRNIFTPLELYCKKRCDRAALSEKLLDRLFPKTLPEIWKLRMLLDVLKWTKPSVDMKKMLECLLWHFKDFRAFDVILPVAGFCQANGVRLYLMKVMEIGLSLYFSRVFSKPEHASLFLEILLELQVHSDIPATVLPRSHLFKIPNYLNKPNAHFSQEFRDAFNALRQQTLTLTYKTKPLMSLQEISFIAMRKVLWKANCSRYVLEKRLPRIFQHELYFKNFARKFYDKWGSSS